MVATYKTHETVTGKEIKVRENNSKRYFTIKTSGGKYRTYPMDKDEFTSARRNWTGNDLQHFLNSESYITVK